LEKTGTHFERRSRLFDHMSVKCVIGCKLLLLAFFEGRSTLQLIFPSSPGKGRKVIMDLRQMREDLNLKRRGQMVPLVLARFMEALAEALGLCMDELVQIFIRDEERAKEHEVILDVMEKYKNRLTA
jgi:hypothetical protein